MIFQRIAEAEGGNGFSIYATAEVIEFLEGIDDEDEREKLLSLLEHVSKEGPPRNREKSKQLVDDIFEFKSYQIRLAYVYGSVRRRTLEIFYAFRKKGDDWPKPRIKAAKYLRRQILEAYEKGTINHVE